MKNLILWIRIRVLNVAAFFITHFYSWHYSSLKIIKKDSLFFPHDITADKNVIYAFWHSKTFVLVPCFRGLNIGILTLLDWKNIIYNKICTHYRYQTVPVTSLMRATVRLKKLLENGHLIGLAVDGPHGPVGVIKPGILFLAKTTGKPIVAMNVHAKKALRIRSRWDNFEIPLPFTEAVISLSEPLQVTENNVKETEERLLSFLKDL